MLQAEKGIIGDIGFSSLSHLEAPREFVIDTPYGKPSDAIIERTLHRVQAVFLSRHGRRHSLSPSEAPCRANNFMLKQMGVKDVVSFSAVGSLQVSITSFDRDIPDQYILKRGDDYAFGAHHARGAAKRN